MRIVPRGDKAARKKTIELDVRRARELGPLPDPVCSTNCPDHHPSIRCNRDCRAAPVRLSSEGAKGPVEPLIAPLVFELKRLGVFHPCWSCQGHDDQSGKLWRVPRVWFYADSVVHIRALANAIDALFSARRLSTRWEIVVTHSDPDNPDTTLSLEPDAAGKGGSLRDLQNDLRVLAEGLERNFWAACDHLGRGAR